MDNLILFRERLDSLSDVEYQKCIISFFEKCMISFNKNSVSSMLFHEFYRELNNDEMDNINSMNLIITDIIAKRPSTQDNGNSDSHYDNDKENIKSHKSQLDDLPSVMISEINAYLSFSESLHFEKCNRSIFIGSRSSNIAIHSLNSDYFTKFITFYKNFPENRLFKWKRIKRFKSVTMHSCDANIDHIFDLKLFKHIHTLRINYKVQSDDSDPDNELSVLLQNLNTAEDLTNITTFRIDNYDLEDVSSFQQIIKNKFKLQYFGYKGITDKFWRKELFDEDFVSKLQGIALQAYEDYYGDHLYPAIGNKLESLHVDEELTEDLHGKLNGLKELCLRHSSDIVGKDKEFFLKQNLQHLKRVHFANIYILNSWILNKIMVTVEYICFNACSFGTAHFDNLCKSFEYSKANRLKIRINNMTLKKSNSVDIGKFIKLFVNGLSLQYSNWMFIIEHFKIPKMISMDNINHFSLNKIHVIPDTVAMEGQVVELSKLNISSEGLFEKLLDSLNDTCLVQFKKTATEHFNDYHFVISNKECNINGYHERWIMQCDKCSQTPIFD